MSTGGLSAVQWATFPLLQLVFQMGDWQGLAENQTKGTTLHGANAVEKATVIAGKLIHYSIIAVIPALLHGLPAAALGSAAYMATQVCSPCCTALTAARQEPFVTVLTALLFNAWYSPV